VQTTKELVSFPSVYFDEAKLGHISDCCSYNNSIGLLIFMKELSPNDLQSWLKENRACLLVDVREDFEHEHDNIGGRLIPLGELMGRAGELPRQIPVVVYCEKGIRSIIAIQRLEGLGFGNLYNLSGGMKAWRASLQEG
jgi:rhodanese-related sulfurtransferase